MYERPLNVSTPEGHRIYAQVFNHDGQIQIRLPYLKEVEKDNPPFGKKGIISVKGRIANYQELIDKVTSYLENLFLKGMANESSHTSHETKSKPGGSVKPRTDGNPEPDKGKRETPSVHSGARGDQPTEAS